jgi:hypothetical protein
VRELRDRRYLDVEGGREIEPPAGDVTEGVVRIGATAPRPHQARSYAIA